MAVRILYIDIRDEKQVMRSYTVAWRPKLTAYDAIRLALNMTKALEVARDLESNDPDILIAWHDEELATHSEVGGVANLDWDIPDKSVLTIVYENQNSTQQQIDASSDWMIQNK